MSEREYPLPCPDLRFSLGLTLDVARVLTARGYPELTSGDLAALRQALHRFLYRDSLDSLDGGAR